MPPGSEQRGDAGGVAGSRVRDYMAEYNQTNSFYHNTMDGTYTTTLEENRRVADDIVDECAAHQDDATAATALAAYRRRLDEALDGLEEALA